MIRDLNLHCDSSKHYPPGLLKGGALDEGEGAVEELHDKVLDLGGLGADGPLLLRQVGVVLQIEK